VLVILFAGFVGAIIYFAVGRPQPNSRATGTGFPTVPNQPPPPSPDALG
jgi:hypothetical protein